jgi:hypothetical protein
MVGSLRKWSLQKVLFYLKLNTFLVTKFSTYIFSECGIFKSLRLKLCNEDDDKNFRNYVNTISKTRIFI